MEQPRLFQAQEVKSELRALLCGLERDECAAVLSSVVLEEVSRLINKFPVIYQKEMIALLTCEFMEQWDREM